MHHSLFSVPRIPLFTSRGCSARFAVEGDTRNRGMRGTQSREREMTAPPIARPMVDAHSSREANGRHEGTPQGCGGARTHKRQVVFRPESFTVHDSKRIGNPGTGEARLTVLPGSCVVGLMRLRHPSRVMPAHAGIQRSKHLRAAFSDDWLLCARFAWTPAFAGVTVDGRPTENFALMGVVPRRLSNPL